MFNSRTEYSPFTFFSVNHRSKWFSSSSIGHIYSLFGGWLAVFTFFYSAPEADGRLECWDTWGLQVPALKDWSLSEVKFRPINQLCGGKYQFLIIYQFQKLIHFYLSAILQKGNSLLRPCIVQFGGLF